jgi:hypothetical protein
VIFPFFSLGTGSDGRCLGSWDGLPFYIGLGNGVLKEGFREKSNLFDLFTRDFGFREYVGVYLCFPGL